MGHGAIGEDLRDPGLSVQAFRLRLEGSLGVGAAWSLMLDAMRREALQPPEVWFYGAELLRTLGEVELPADADQGIKQKVLADFCARVRSDLSSLGLEREARPWVQRIRAFYKEASA